MSALLSEYKHFRAFDSDLMAEYGDDLINAKTEQVELVHCDDVIAALKKFRSGEITQEILLEWVNTLFFTELFYYADGQDDSIASVMTELETLDEDGVFYTDDEYDRMIAALETNAEFER